jgi:hypothetical protein
MARVAAVTGSGEDRAADREGSPWLGMSHIWFSRDSTGQEGSCVTRAPVQLAGRPAEGTKWPLSFCHTVAPSLAPPSLPGSGREVSVP